MTGRKRSAIGGAIRRTVLVTGSLLLASCATSTPGLRYLPGDPSDDISGLETAISLEPAAFAAGQDVSITITFSNVTDRDIRIRFPPTRQIALLVHDATGAVAYTDDRTVKVPRYLTLGPLEEWETTATWNGRMDLGDRGIVLPPGKYRLQAALRRSGVLYVNRTAAVDFEVVADWE